jgi:adenylate cyclase
MPGERLDSSALRLAELRSERVRILGLLAFIAIFCFVLTFRHFLLHTTLYTSHTGWNIALSLIIATYEYLMLRLVDRAIRKGENFPTFLWVSTTILETCIPAIGIGWQSTSGMDAAYLPIASPATLLFFIFIMLSILRLNPWICWLSGVTASISYLVAAIYLG